MATKITSLKTKNIKNIKNIPKKKELNKKIYEKAIQLNNYKVKIHCSVNLINNQFLHKLREKISPAILFFGKKSVLKKVFNFNFEKNSFIIFTDLENKERIINILNKEFVNSFPLLDNEGEIIIKAGKMSFPSFNFNSFKKFNLNVELENGDIILKTDFIWKGIINRNILNLYKLLNLKTETSPLKILDIIN